MFYTESRMKTVYEKTAEAIKRATRSLRCMRDFILFLIHKKPNDKNVLHSGMVMRTYNDDIVKTVATPKYVQDNIAYYNKAKADENTRIACDELLLTHCCSKCYYYTRGCKKQCGTMFGKLYFKLINEQPFVSRDISADK